MALTEVTARYLLTATPNLFCAWLTATCNTHMPNHTSTTCQLLYLHMYVPFLTPVATSFILLVDPLLLMLLSNINVLYYLWILTSGKSVSFIRKWLVINDVLICRWPASSALLPLVINSPQVANEKVLFSHSYMDQSIPVHYIGEVKHKSRVACSTFKRFYRVETWGRLIMWLTSCWVPSRILSAKPRVSYKLFPTTLFFVDLVSPVSHPRHVTPQKGACHGSIIYTV
jgi:hypothetical protein